MSAKLHLKLLSMTSNLTPQTNEAMSKRSSVHVFLFILLNTVLSLVETDHAIQMLTSDWSSFLMSPGARIVVRRTLRMTRGRL